MNRICIFVYGTLREGGSNHFRLAGARRVSAGIVHGSLYRIDWYPGVLLGQEAGTVVGEVYQVDETTLTSLDAYEGDEYRRVLTRFHPDDGGAAIEVWIWEYRMPVEGLRRIPSGDWLKAEPAS